MPQTLASVRFITLIDCSFLGDFPLLAFTNINYKDIRDPSVFNNKVIIHSDHTTAVAIINKGTTKSTLIMHYIRSVFWCFVTYNFSLHTVYVPGHCNVLKEHTSRLLDATHFTLFLKLLQGGFAPEAYSSPAFPHISSRTYAYLLDKYAVLQSFPKYLRLTLVFMWNSAIREKFNFYFSRVFC